MEWRSILREQNEEGGKKKTKEALHVLSVKDKKST